MAKDDRAERQDRAAERDDRSTWRRSEQVHFVRGCFSYSTCCACDLAFTNLVPSTNDIFRSQLFGAGALELAASFPSISHRPIPGSSFFVRRKPWL